MWNFLLAGKAKNFLRDVFPPALGTIHKLPPPRDIERRTMEKSFRRYSFLIRESSDSTLSTKRTNNTRLGRFEIFNRGRSPKGNSFRFRGKNYKKNYKWGREKIISDRRIIRKAKSNGNAYPGVTRAWINWRVEGWYGIIRKLLGIEWLRANYHMIYESVGKTTRREERLRDQPGFTE